MCPPSELPAEAEPQLGIEPLLHFCRKQKLCLVFLDHKVFPSIVFLAPIAVVGPVNK